MSLVPEHIDEAIKHLSPRSVEELKDTMYKLPLYDQLPFANQHKIPMSRNEVNAIRRKVRDEVPILNKLLKREIKKLNRHYNLDLPIYRDSEFFMETSSYSTICSSGAHSIRYDSPSTGIFAAIIKTVEIESKYVIFPEGGFKIILQYNWEHFNSSNGCNRVFMYDKDGNLVS